MPGIILGIKEINEGIAWNRHRLCLANTQGNWQWANRDVAPDKWANIKQTLLFACQAALHCYLYTNKQ